MVIRDSAGGKVRYPGRLKAQGQGGNRRERRRDTRRVDRAPSFVSALVVQARVSKEEKCR